MKLTLNDGTVFENSHAIENGGNLFIYVQDGQSSIRDVFNAFADPEKTVSIQFENMAGDLITLTGYNRIIAVRDEGRGLITAVLTIDRAA